MVSKELQDKFYAALESLRDSQNGYLLEALAAGAKASFESINSNDAPVATPAGQHPNKMIAEAIAKLGETIISMRTEENAALVEAIKSGCDSCFTFNFDGNGWTPDEENPQPSAPAAPAEQAPQGKYQFVGANEAEGEGDTADGVYAHGELEDRLGYDILCFCGTTLEQFQQDIVNGYHDDPNFGNGIPVTVKGIDEPCSLYVWYTQFANGFVLPRGVVVLNSDTDAVNYAKEVWTEKPQRF